MLIAKNAWNIKCIFDNWNFKMHLIAYRGFDVHLEIVMLLQKYDYAINNDIYKQAVGFLFIKN